MNGLSLRMQPQKNIIECYDRTASEYANKFINELDKKHLDKILLQSFALENMQKGKLLDLGCGPGQTTKFLFDAGVKEIVGIDLSPEMVAIAKKLNPNLNFEVGDMLKLHFADNSIGAAIAFYSIVHFAYDQISIAFKDINRVMIPGGQFLFSFHVGTEPIHLDNFLDQPVNIDFYFFDTARITSLLTETGFNIIDIIEREPYIGFEHPSRRAYLWAQTK